MSLHPSVRVCVRMHVYVRVCVCVCTFAQAHTCSRAHECIYACIKHLAQSCLCPHCLCLCLSIHWCACVCLCVCVHERACGVISLCLGRGIFMLISVPSGQTQLSCLLKRDNIANAKLETSVSICTSVHRISISSVAPHHKTASPALTDHCVRVCFNLLLFQPEDRYKYLH